MTLDPSELRFVALRLKTLKTPTLHNQRLNVVIKIYIIISGTITKQSKSLFLKDSWLFKNL